jgi:hypothetical protein
MLRYYIRRDRLNGKGLLVTLYWSGRRFDAIEAHGYVKASTALKTAGKLTKRGLCDSREITICATNY